MKFVFAFFILGNSNTENKNNHSSSGGTWITGAGYVPACHSDYN